MLADKSLVILSESFGTNFSGGTSATHFLFKPLQAKFKEIVFVGKQVGTHEFDRLTFKKYINPVEAIKIIKELGKSRDAIFYGDFYMSYFFILAGVPFYFTYHDNWPEQAKLSLRDWFRGWFYSPLYRWIIRRSAWTFTVSQFKLNFVDKLTDRCSLVRNGMVLPPSPKIDSNQSKIELAMVGNIDHRKYDWALDLCHLIADQSLGEGIKIDIYGKVLDQRLADKLAGFPFIEIKGYQATIPLGNYAALISASKMENLAISVVEALRDHVPVIAFDVGGLGEVVNEKNGRLIGPADVKAMLDQILKLPSEQFEFNDAALKEFDWEVAAKAYAEVILADHE